MALSGWGSFFIAWSCKYPPVDVGHVSGHIGHYFLKTAAAALSEAQDAEG